MQGEEMRRLVTWMVLLGFFNIASVANARAGDRGTTPSETDNEPVAKPDEPAKSEARGSEKDAVESEIQEMRNLLQSQTLSLIHI